MTRICAILVGFALDLLLGDPRALPHPVVFMGRAIRWLEDRLRRVFPQDNRGVQRAGICLAVILPLAGWTISYGVLWVCGLLHPWVRFGVEAFMCFQILATRELWRQSMAVFSALEECGLVAAREAVARIVGRDTKNLDEKGVIRAAVETVAENACDGVVAPMVFLFLGGAPLGMLYKAINTMDSMVGYKNERYLFFGRAAAKLDDVANYIPARFCALCMVLTAPLLGLSARNAWRMWRRDGRKHASPNAAQTEAACAGALGVQLAGNACYFGMLVEKPTIGDGLRPVERQDIPRSNRLMLFSSLLALFVCTALAAGVVMAKGV